MAIAFVQDDIGSVADGGTLAFGSNVSAGSALVAFIGMATATVGITTITDTRGNTWVRLEDFASDGKRAAIFHAANPNAGANTLTFDWDGTATAQVCIAEFSGFPDGVSVDVTGSNSTPGGATNHPHVTTAVTTSQAVALALSTGRVSGAFSVSSVGDSFVALTYQGRTVQHYRILASTATFDGDITTAASEQITMALGVIYPTAPAGVSRDPAAGSLAFTGQGTSLGFGILLPDQL
jgi:hypothetical protein